MSNDAADEITEGLKIGPARISIDPRIMELQAGAYGADPGTAASGEISQLGQTNQQLQQEAAQGLQAARARSAGSFTAENYTQTNHGLQSLPHIDNQD